MKSIPIVGLWNDKIQKYMFIAIKDVIYETIDNWWLSYSLITQENNLILKKWWNAALAEVQITYVCHLIFWFLKSITEYYKPY